MRRYLIRLWAHEAEDGFLPEVTVVAENALHAAAIALREFESAGRPMTPEAYLESEPRGDVPLRVRDVVAWRSTPEGATFLRRLDPASIGC